MIYYCWEFNPNLILKGQCQMNRQFLFVCITRARKLLLPGNYSRLILFLLLASNLSVLTARADGPTKNKVVFAVIGDSGTGKQDQIDLARVMEKFYEREPFDTVIMLGDNIYGDVSRKSLHQCFEKPYEKLLERGVGFYATLGNHGNSLAECEYKPFHMEGRHYYTFTQGKDLVQFFSLDSNQMDREQLGWLEKELAASKARWKVAFFHHPIYSSGRTHGSDQKLRRLVEPIFIKYGVNVVFSGHDHLYERLKPQNGILYFVSGGASKVRKGNLNRSDPSMASGNDETLHFMLVEAGPDSLHFRAIGANGEVIDEGKTESSEAVRK
ncbi:MAG: metallophosphoesterase [Blastocatellia bacterium AA13]|nr:MAG: metallophosphoesterase [Blastocatellia bacterium AA13]